MQQHLQTLHPAFTGLFSTLPSACDLAPLFDELSSLYSAPSRHYHNATHLLHCLNELLNSPDPANIPVAFALWFHDAIYDPTP